MCINFRYFFSFKNTVKSKMVDLSWSVKWRHTQQNCIIAQGYLINVNLIPYENLGEWFHQPPPPSPLRQLLPRWGYELAYTYPI